MATWARAGAASDRAGAGGLDEGAARWRALRIEADGQLRLLKCGLDFVFSSHELGKCQVCASRKGVELERSLQVVSGPGKATGKKMSSATGLMGKCRLWSRLHRLAGRYNRLVSLPVG